MIAGGRVRLFLDSKVLTGGIAALWGLDKAVLSLRAAGICRMVPGEAVRREVEENFLSMGPRVGEKAAAKCPADFRKLAELASPEIVSTPTPVAVTKARSLIRHEADVPCCSQRSPPGQTGC